MSEMVWRAASATSQVYHTDEDCTALNQAERSIKRDLDQLGDWDECAICSGEYDQHIPQGNTLAARLDDADPDLICGGRP